MVELCRHHHVLVHEAGFGCERSADGRLVFRDQRGDVLPEAYIPQCPPAVIDPVRWFEIRMPDVDVDSATRVTLWDGEAMDYGMAVEALVAYE